MGDASQILQDQLCDHRIVVEHARHGLQLLGMVKIERVLPQAVLGFASFAHSDWPLFLAKFSRIKGLATPILETQFRKSQPECVFKPFFYRHLQPLGQELPSHTTFVQTRFPIVPAPLRFRLHIEHRR